MIANLLQIAFTMFRHPYDAGGDTSVATDASATARCSSGVSDASANARCIGHFAVTRQL
jgi:hypothetical protein